MIRRFEHSKFGIFTDTEIADYYMAIKDGIGGYVTKNGTFVNTNNVWPVESILVNVRKGMWKEIEPIEEKSDLISFCPTIYASDIYKVDKKIIKDTLNRLGYRIIGFRPTKEGESFLCCDGYNIGVTKCNSLNPRLILEKLNNDTNIDKYM